MDKKSFALELKNLDADGTFEGYAATFGNVDYHGDLIEKGAFKRTLDHMRQGKKALPILWQHRIDEPIGRAEELREDDHGLYIKGRLVLDTARGREAYALLKAGVLGGLSIGYASVKDKWEEGVRKIKEIKLYETSLVTFPANPEAAIVGVKGIAPANVSQKIAPENTPWKKPVLADFTDQPWDELDDAEKRRIAGHYAWSPKRAPEKFTDLKLPHHRPEDGAVVWRGVRAAMAALLGARGGVQIPDADRRKVYDHLAKHYAQFDKEPPEFKAYSDWELAQEFPAEAGFGVELKELVDSIKALLSTGIDPKQSHSVPEAGPEGGDEELAEIIRELKAAAGVAE